jgi:hypothetical protein
MQVIEGQVRYPAHFRHPCRRAFFEDVKLAQNLVASLMTPDQIAEAQRLAREWLAKHQF